MKLHLEQAGVNYLFTGYGSGFVAVNQQKIETNLILLPEKLIAPWEASSFENLSEDDFSFLASLPIEMLILGTGAKLRFPHPKLTEPLRRAKIGFEVMDTQAACRTYNILVTEGRQIGTALFI